MSNKNIKIIVSAVLILVLLFSFTACAKTEKEPASNGGQSAQSTEEENVPSVDPAVDSETPENPNAETTENVSESSTEKEEETMPSNPVAIKVTCSSVTSDGKLLTKCAAASAGGQNLVPGISWDAVPSAKAYAVFMLDESANNWMHLKTVTTTAGIQEGATISGQYVGPYPPSGNHTYTIYVIALSDAPSSLPGKFDSTNSGINTLIDSLGVTALGSGSVSVTYAHGDNNT